MLATRAGQVEPSDRLAIDVDELDALLIEKAWRSPLTPMQSKEILRWSYVYRRPWFEIARRQVIRRIEWPWRFSQAHTTIGNVLHRMAPVAQGFARAYNAPQIGPPPSSATPERHHQGDVRPLAANLPA